MIEKRKFKRAQDNFVVIVYSHLDTGKEVRRRAIAENISKGGIKARVSKKYQSEITKGLPVNLQLFTVGDPIAFELKGEVIWINYAPKNMPEEFIAGIKFNRNQSNSQELERLYLYVERLNNV